MDRVIVYSKEDTAGVNIAHHLKDHKMHSVDGSQLYVDNLIHIFSNCEFIFASKHKSETKKPSLTVHAPGNWCSADYGGVAGKVCIANASFISEILNYFSKNSKLGWDVTLEVTHHGPFLNAPATFVEIGSSENEWQNEEAGQLVADAITIAMKTTDVERDKQKTAAIGVGGGHYAPTFSRLVLKGQLIGHIIPQYALDCITFESFKDGIEQNVEKIEKVLIDWKGTKKEQREKIQSFCEKLAISWVRV
jgi:D-aminoacyl-tRNA deacylase